ncbi:MAG: tRNA (guanosine(46)-N7)-methyltransferase TrmB [Clostridia bacterium]|nr:tRNA (guanosine(46)-N7)-methyltransferase TrmB [Clostridia bacterium]
MRMRKKKHGAERIAACSELLIENIEILKDGFDGIFPESRPVHMEIGCGKGNFASGMAAKHQDVNFVAVEKVSDVCCIALEKAKARTEERPNDNLRFIIGDAKNLAENVKPHSLDCIYLNFSDPWPKSGHAKRRLTHRGFLEIYKNMLKPGGILKLKTDNVGLFDFSLEEFEAFGAEILWHTRDLHSTPENADNVMTEYEKNFSDKGTPICSAWVKFR